MKIKSRKILLSCLIVFASCCGEAKGEMPMFFGGSTKTPVEKKAPDIQTKPMTPPVVAEKNDVASQSVLPQTPAVTVPVYDPFIDNHLKAPASDKTTGLFGMKVKQVEERLKSLGARSHSYAFGKYSRMIMSAYLITIYFDRERRVGGFLVEPRRPYTTLEPAAREYFMNTFLEGADLAKFAITMAGDHLEIQYKP